MLKDMTENELMQLIKQLNLEELEYNEEQTMPSEQDGWVQVKDQSIIVHNPTGNGKCPVIQANAPVKLIVNDVPVESECTVTSNDRIEWVIEEPALFDITVSEDKLRAYFQLVSKDRYAWRLTDTEPMQQVTVSAEENKDIVLGTVQLEDVIGQLEIQSIRSNLDIPAIQVELLNPTYQPVLIARGKAARLGENARIEVYFKEQVENQFFEILGQIDYRNHLQIPSVGIGERIAKKFPLVDGVPGYDVFGNVIVPDTPEDVMVVAKPGVKFTPEGEIIALREGRPRITGGKIKTFDISTSYVIPGDVTIETGNIVFSGDIIVYGNVMDNMIVESLGNVYVYGSVFNATITATGSIYVRGNVMGSRLYSGHFGVLFNRLYNASKNLAQLVEKLFAASKVLLQALESKNQKVPLGQIAMLLIESKFKTVPATVKELLSIISNIQHIKKEEYNRLREMSEVFLHLPRLLKEVDYSFLQSFQSLLTETSHDLERMREDTTEIRLNQCHKTVIKSNGNIVFHRDGVILSDLYATGHIIFKHDDAVCRGSRMEAGGSIRAKMVGGQTGAGSFLKAMSEVTVQKIFSGRICVGKYCTDIDKEAENITFNIHTLTAMK